VVDFVDQSPLASALQGSVAKLAAVSIEGKPRVAISLERAAGSPQ